MLPPTFRAALYWTPPPDDPLARAGHAWLGRDPERNTTIAQPDIPGIADLTAAPRHYGFHATLRPPMHLATDWPAFCAAAETIAQTTEPFALPTLEVAAMSGFLALRATAPCRALHSLADTCVAATEPHRLPPSEAELAKRRAQNLTPRQETLLARWGYPYVMEEWRFHLTLTRRLDDAEMERVLPQANAHFAAALAMQRQLTDIAVFTQVRQQPFLVAERLEFKKGVLF